MIRDKMPRGMITKDAIVREVYRLRELAKSQGYVITPEPLSNLFAKHVTVTVESILNQDDPLRAKVVSKAAGEWRPQSLAIMKALDNDNIPFREYMGRSGGPYFQLPVKKIAKLNRYMGEAIRESDYLWRQPWWKEIGVPVFKHMLVEYQKQSLLNIDKIIAEPELAIGDKPEDTGTGWFAPISNRRQLAQNIERAAPYMRNTIDEYYKDMVEALNYWPENDIMIQLGVGYKGIQGGVRSDVDVTKWTAEYQELESTARKVGNDPSSAVHNKVLDNIVWRQQMWSQTTTPYHLDISDVASYELVRSTPPASIGGEEDEMRLVSADFGWTDTLPTITKKGIIPGNEHIGFGADNISLLGIVLNTAENAKILMMESGAPFTMMHYNVMVGQALGYWAKKLSLHMKVLQIGDDLHIILPLGEIPSLFDAMGHSLRLKGMIHTSQGDGVFILGKWIWWKGVKQMTAVIAPRYLKSLTSAKRKEAGTLPQSVQVGIPYITENTDPDIEEQIQKIWSMYPELIYYKGSPDEYKSRMTALAAEGYKAIAQTGMMDWMTEEGIDETFGRESFKASPVTTIPALDGPIAGPAVPEIPIVMPKKEEVQPISIPVAPEIQTLTKPVDKEEIPPSDVNKFIHDEGLQPVTKKEEEKKKDQNGG